MLKIDSVAAFNDNYIWLIHAPDGQHVLIVDPGDAEPVIEVIQQRNLIPVAVLITHGCHDHVDGIETLLQHYDVPVYGPNNEFIPYLTHPLFACNELMVSSLFPAICVLDIPGHTKGHIGFLIDGCLFCGDTLFAAGCGRLHGNPAELLFQSLQQISQLPLDTKIYCAHEYTEANLRFAATLEPKNADIKQRIIDTALMRNNGGPSLPSTMRLELETNPFLRCEQSNIVDAAQRFSGQILATPVDVFTALRLWKDRQA